MALQTDQSPIKGAYTLSSTDATPNDKVWVPSITTSAVNATEDMTPLEKETARISAEQWNRYVETFRPFEDKVMQDVRQGTPQKTQVLSAINANLMQQQPGLVDYARTHGGRASAIGRIAGSQEAGLAGTSARGAIEGLNALASDRAATTQALVELGRGGADTAISGLGQAARLATEATISDWQYQLGQERLASDQQMFDARLDAADNIQTMEYLSSLFSSASGVVGYGAHPEQGWFEFGGGAVDPWAGWNAQNMATVMP